MKKLFVLLGLLISSFTAMGADMSNGADNFYKSSKVTARKVTFKNQYQMTVAGNLFIPNGLNSNAKTPAIIVGHPMGAVKEQSSNLYAQKLAEQGFVTLSLDLSFWGRVRAGHAMPCRQTSMPRTSAPRWIFSAPGRSLTASGSAFSASAAAAASSSAQRRSIRA